MSCLHGYLLNKSKVIFSDFLYFSDKCVIFNPDDNASQRFIQILKEQFRINNLFITDSHKHLSMKALYIDSFLGNMSNQEFEFVILETALENIVNKFR